MGGHPVSLPPPTLYMPPCTPWVYPLLYIPPCTPWVYHTLYIPPCTPLGIPHPALACWCTPPHRLASVRRSPGLKPAKSRGWEDFLRFGAQEVCLFLCLPRAEYSRSCARNQQRSDSRAGLGGSGHTKGASDIPSLREPLIPHHWVCLPASEAGRPTAGKPWTFRTFP